MMVFTIIKVFKEYGMIPCANRPIQEQKERKKITGNNRPRGQEKM